MLKIPTISNLQAHSYKLTRWWGSDPASLGEWLLCRQRS